MRGHAQRLWPKAGADKKKKSMNEKNLEARLNRKNTESTQKFPFFPQLVTETLKKLAECSRLL